MSNPIAFPSVAASSARADTANRLPLSRKMQMLGAAGAASFERILGLARDLIGAPHAGILFDEAGQSWFQFVGESVGTQVNREGSFEAHTRAADDIFFVADARLDPRFKDHPRVVGEPYIRAYVGAPLIDETGERIGALAVLAMTPLREPEDFQRRMLKHLAGDVMTELRLGAEKYLSAISGATKNAILRGTGEAIITVDRDRGILFFTNAFDGPLPRDDNPTGQDLDALLRVDPGTRLHDALERGMNGETVADFDEFHAGLGRMINFRVFPVAGIGAALTCREASRAYRAEAALRASEARLRRSEEHLERAQALAEVGSGEFDFTTGAGYWSPQVYRIFGLAPGAVPATNEVFHDIVHPDDRARLDENRLRQERGEIVPRCEYRIVRPDGEVRRILRMGDVTFDAAGRPARYLITIQDVTELREAERQRDEFQRQMLHTQRLEALGTLAGGIAHDLNNTLVPVLALAKLMLKDRPEGEERRNLEVIQRAGEQARDLVRRVLAFARKGPIERKPVDLRAVVDDALKMLRVSVPPRIAIEERLGAVAPVLADAGQIHQVVVNLVTNAAQAIGERDGTISISLGTRPGDPGSIRLAVADDGPGMSDAVQARVFEPFFSTKGIGAGSGLGLSIVHGIVTGHGGSVAVDSRPGRGARFTVDLPAATTPSAMTSAAASAAA